MTASTSYASQDSQLRVSYCYSAIARASAVASTVAEVMCTGCQTNARTHLEVLECWHSLNVVLFSCVAVHIHIDLCQQKCADFKQAHVH
jgi:hypothetical protein